MLSTPRRRFFASLVVVFALEPGINSAATDYGASVRVLNAPVANELVVRGLAGDRVVRRTAYAIESARVATAEGISFVTWREVGPSQAVDRFTLSHDGGATWREARAIRYDIPMKIGTIEPGLREPPSIARLASIEVGPVYIVQFHTPSSPAWRARVTELGGEIVAFLPHNAHLVRMTAKDAERVRSATIVRWVGVFRPDMRLDPTLIDAFGDELDAGERSIRRRYSMSTFKPGPLEKASLAREVVAAGGAVVAQSKSGYILEAELTLDEVAPLLSSRHLLWIEPWNAPQHDMDIVRATSGANYIETIGGYDGSGVVGEVMDGGIQPDHQDFDGIQFHGGFPPAEDHGTACYGIVFGNGDRDGDGDPTALGHLPAAQGYFASYQAVGDRYVHTQELAQPPIEAVFQSNSWGSGRTLHYTAVSAEMDDIIWSYDFTIFQSQSNSGDQYSRPQAWAKNIISVGGVRHYDNIDPLDDCWCSSASTGPANDGRIKPDLSHYYDDVWTTDREPGGYSGGLYSGFGGTSAATPVVAGLGGLVYEMWADNIYGNNPQGTSVFDRRPHSSTLKAILINTATQYDFAGPDDDHARARQGWGIPNVQSVLDRAPLTKIIDESSTLGVFEFDAYLATVGAGQPELEITMVFTDRAAAPPAAVHRVNDVTLKVIAPDGTVYWGNGGLLDGPWSTPGGSADTINTVENVFVQNPRVGDWRVEIYADEVNQDVHVETPGDDQDYALVVYGVSQLTECRSLEPAPTGSVAAPTAANEITVSWSGAAGSYEIWRTDGGCGAPQTLVGTSATTSFVDTTAQGGIVYGYTVRSVGACPSSFDVCTEATATGSCAVDPSFDGLGWARGMGAGACGIELTWNVGTSACGGNVVYNVYRSTNPVFTPSAAELVASCLTAATYLDAGVAGAIDYTYIVRAEDPTAVGTSPCGGREDGNVVRRGLTPMTVLRTDFERGLDGWTAIIPALSITGEFVVDDPRGTLDNGVPAQPEDDHTPAGTQCLYTGRNLAGSAAQADVDFGAVEAVTPVFDASAYTTLSASYWRWHFNRDLNEDVDDFFEVEVTNDGTNWTRLEFLDTNTSANAWTQATFALESFVPLTSTMQLRFRSSDGDNVGNLIESAIDDIVIESADMCTAASLPGVITGPGPLFAVKNNGMVRFSWEFDCASGLSFGLYAGDLTVGSSSAAAVAGMCDIATTTVDIPLDPGKHFYWVAPNTGSFEGSLGLLNLGQRRPQPALACYPRNIDACAP